MTIFLILSGAVVGTSLMTLYSYIVAGVRDKQFKEPVLLNKLVSRSVIYKGEVMTGGLLGWIIHYSIGFSFVVIYHFVWQWTPIEPSYLHGALLGAVSGLAGILGWKVMFKLNSNPPHIDIKEYYLHLMIAHVIFGLGAVAGYRLF